MCPGAFFPVFLSTISFLMSDTTNLILETYYQGPRSLSFIPPKKPLLQCKATDPDSKEKSPMQSSARNFNDNLGNFCSIDDVKLDQLTNSGTGLAMCTYTSIFIPFLNIDTVLSSVPPSSPNAVAIWQNPIIYFESSMLATEASDTNSFPVVIWENPTIHLDSSTLAIEASDTRCICHAPFTEIAISQYSFTTTTKASDQFEVEFAFCSAQNVVPLNNFNVVAQFTSPGYSVVKASTTTIKLTDKSWGLGPPRTSSTEVDFVEYSTEQEQAIETEPISKVDAVICFTITLVASFFYVMTALIKRERTQRKSQLALELKFGQLHHSYDNNLKLIESLEDDIEEIKLQNKEKDKLLRLKTAEHACLVVQITSEEAKRQEMVKIVTRLRQQFLGEVTVSMRLMQEKRELQMKSMDELKKAEARVADLVKELKDLKSKNELKIITAKKALKNAESEVSMLNSKVTQYCSSTSCESVMKFKERFNTLVKSLSNSEKPLEEHNILFKPNTADFEQLQTVVPGNDWPLTWQISSMPQSAETTCNVSSQQLPSIPHTAVPDPEDETPTTEQIPFDAAETNDDDEPCSPGIPIISSASVFCSPHLFGGEMHTHLSIQRQPASCTSSNFSASSLVNSVTSEKLL